MDHIEQASEIQSGIRLLVYLPMVFIQLVFGGCRSPTLHLQNCIGVHFIVIFRVFKELNQSWCFYSDSSERFLAFVWLPVQVSSSLVLSLRNWVLKNHYQPSLLRAPRWVSCEAYVSQGLDCIWIWYWVFKAKGILCSNIIKQQFWQRSEEAQESPRWLMVTSVLGVVELWL